VITADVHVLSHTRATCRGFGSHPHGNRISEQRVYTGQRLPPDKTPTSPVRRTKTISTNHPPTLLPTALRHHQPSTRHPINKHGWVDIPLRPDESQPLHLSRVRRAGGVLWDAAYWVRVKSLGVEAACRVAWMCGGGMWMMADAHTRAHLPRRSEVRDASRDSRGGWFWVRHA
jgi:hypothetical protein